MKTFILRQSVLFGCAALSLVLSGGYALHHSILAFQGELPQACVKLRQQELSFLSGNLQLSGTLYSPACPSQKRPGIVLSHGATGFGRRLAMYSIMAPKLAQQGYIVLSMNFRGFGDSDDPQRLESFADLDFAQDISAALNVLAKHQDIDPSRLFVLGHSFGAGVGLAAGVRDTRVTAVVSISPPRLARERFFAPNASDPDFPQRRISSRMELPQLIPKALIDPHFKDYIAEAILDYPEHPPVLFVDGAKEPQEEIEFLHTVYEDMTPPKGAITIAGADHYFGTKFEQAYTEGLAYNEEIMNDLVAKIDRWLKDLKQLH